MPSGEKSGSLFWVTNLWSRNRFAPRGLLHPDMWWPTRQDRHVGKQLPIPRKRRESAKGIDMPGFLQSMLAGLAPPRDGRDAYRGEHTRDCRRGEDDVGRVIDGISA